MPIERIGRYMVGEMWADKEDPASCSDCDWSGTVSGTKVIEDCALSAGDQSPCGRCPICECLAYLDRPKDRILDAAEDLYSALKIAREWMGSYGSAEKLWKAQETVDRALRYAEKGRR